MAVDIFDMDPFDIESIVPKIFPTVDLYYNFCKDNYFYLCKDASVLEIGAGHGIHSLKILEQNPAHLSIIEGDSLAAQRLLEIDLVTVTVDDVMMALKNKNPFDVVICLGVLYHLHSPLHLLELIVNHCEPKIIILDCVMAPAVLQFENEEPNHSGNNQTRSQWRSAGVNLVAPFLTYLQCMHSCGYALDRVDRIQVDNHWPKKNSWMALWRKQ